MAVKKKKKKIKRFYKDHLFNNSRSR